MPWLAATAQKTPDISCLLDPQGQMVYLNQAAETIFLAPERMELCWLAEFDASDSPSSALSHLDILQKATDEQSWRGFLKHRLPGADWKSLAVTVVPLAADTGEIARFHLSGHDITALSLPALPSITIETPQFDLMMGLLEDVVSLHDDHLNTLYATPAVSRITGLSPKQIVGKSAFIRVHPEDRQRVLHTLRCLKRQGEAVVRWRHSNSTGEWCWLETRVRLLESSWAPATYLCATRDITQQLATAETVLWRTQHDILTELPNREYFLKQVQSAIDTLPSEHMLATLFIDLDGFKRINDSLGHETGDALLRVVAQRLRDTLRTHDSVGRLGGDEFTILLNPVHSIEETEVLVRRILPAVARSVVIGGQELFVGTSIGISLYPDDGTDPETLIQHADVAMDQAKRTGNNFCYFDRSMHDATQERLRQERCLRRALDQGEFEMHYQPLCDPQTGEVGSLEALLRWKRPAGEQSISPARFIAVAEECGLIEPLGSWTLQTVCEQAAAWHTEWGSCPIVAVNVSTLQLTQPWFLRRVKSVLSTTGLPPDRLEIEITESALLGQGNVAQQTLAGLHALGIRIAVDDFGTGYSSLSYLRDLPLDCLKIDAAFLVDLVNSPQTQAIIRAIIELSHALDLEVIAEGVEEATQRRILAELGCDRIQGFLISPAVSALAIPDLLHRLKDEETHPAPRHLAA